ncbi:tyrosine-type recombinase/integrase [Sciscionella marina]|uniref:tyrosine-type recombinase/integrase n=1 Tax=Sciscionella marina TaxID=508770 RepID=UPI00036A37EB|nr:tyrosine-type recombinase/integrase [Sciscionella marina]
MTALAPILQAFFTDKLLRQRRAGPNTVAAYRDTWRLLLQFAARATATPPSTLDLRQLDAGLITAFLTYLEAERSNGTATRNARLAAVRSLFRYAALHAPKHAADIARVLAIPPKRRDRPIVSYLTTDEIDALVAAPDRGTRLGRRDHALLVLACQTGLRVSELIGLTHSDIHLGPGTHVRCHGKGRKDRATPLTRHTVAALQEWLTDHTNAPIDPLFTTREGRPLSRDAVAKLVTKHTAHAASICPSLTSKTVSPHTLRHSAAMALLHAGVDTSVIALWLGHEDPGSTHAYLHADMSIKENALGRLTPPNTSPGRYRPTDTLLDFLDTL